ncbi:hypothetical protein LFM09_08085 [Lentzea alba]|uniref:hypothetical protein n=1 Tax=Lentzea alba TaxID=2714351 RepID=UPI0039BF2A9C
MKHSDQSTDNDVSGDNSGTAIQAGSIGGDVYVGTPGKLSWRKALRYSAVPTAALLACSAVAAVALLALDEPAPQTPAAATASASAETGTPSAPAVSTPGAPARPTTAGAARPAPGGKATSSTSSRPVTVEPTTTTVAVAAAPPPAGVRFSGTLQFGSFHLDLAQPRDMPGTNIWPLTPGRLHGDDGYWLAEWLSDNVPGQAECADHVGQKATRDAENLIAGSRVCGQTPGGRIFLVDVVALDSSTITGQVTVWD